jgi:hypothetical protein
MGIARHGPEFSPVSREDKVNEWAAAIQTGLRHQGGDPVTDAEALTYADRFWINLEHRCVSVKAIMRVPGVKAVEFALAVDDKLVLLVSAAEPEEEHETKDS